MKNILKKITCFILAVILMISCFAIVDNTQAKAAKPIVIVIDPGHGGSNLGTNYLPIPENIYNDGCIVYERAA